MPDIYQEAIAAAKKFAYAEATKYFGPSIQHIDLAIKIGEKLAVAQKADNRIVQLGLYLMDCKLGEAIHLGKIREHINMSYLAAEKFLGQCAISDREKTNILYCVREHHGVKKFFSRESEVCCNSDCYRFASVRGFTIALKYSGDMAFPDLIKLLGEKADEKWNALTIAQCQKELKPQYQIIKKFLAYLQVIP